MTDTCAVDQQVDHAPTVRASREVVVGFDGTPESEGAVRWAAVRAFALGASLTVLHAVPLPGSGLRLEVPGATPPFEVALRERSSQVAARGARLARAAEPGLSVRGVGVVGGAAAELIAHSADAAMLVVGRRRPGHVLVAALGSVSFAVSMHARCPVVVCPPGTAVQPRRSPRPVLVGVDGSSGSMAALDLGAAVAVATGSAVAVVAAWQDDAGQSWGGGFTAPPAQEVASERLERAEHHLHAQHPALEVSSSTVEGDAVDVLVAASPGVGLVVVGSRGEGGFAGMMLGSVSHGVLRSAASPVAVVRRGAFA
jgi:nucleotide-binding universal stress UspA family protein